MIGNPLPEEEKIFHSSRAPLDPAGMNKSMRAFWVPILGVRSTLGGCRPDPPPHPPPRQEGEGTLTQEARRHVPVP